MSERLPRLPDERLLKAREILGLFTRKGLSYSFLIHGFIVLLFLSVSAYRFLFLGGEEQKALEKKALEASLRQAIRVDVVDLPSLKISDIVNIDPTEDVAAPVPQKEAESEPKDAPQVMTDKTSKAVETPKKSKDRIAELRESMRAEARRKEISEKFAKDLGKDVSGRPELAGNKLSEGFSITGDIASDAEAYHGRLKAHLNRHWELPGWIQASKLRARVWMKIAPDGRILEKRFVKKSGNGDFDEQVAKAIENANPFPAPPDHLVRLYFEEGVVWGFPE